MDFDPWQRHFSFFDYARYLFVFFDLINGFPTHETWRGAPIATAPDWGSLKKRISTYAETAPVRLRPLLIKKVTISAAPLLATP